MARNYQNKQASAQYTAILNDLSKFPFSFIYGGKKYYGFSEEHFKIKSKSSKRIGDKETNEIKFAFSDSLETTFQHSFFMVV